MTRVIPAASRRLPSGFSLVELMVSLAVVAIVATFAVASYRDYVRTAEIDLMHKKIDSLRMFQEGYFLDEGEYLPGSYDPEGANDFEMLGFRIPNDDDGVRLVVAACDGGAIDTCYKVTATNRSGETVVWNAGAYEAAP